MTARTPTAHSATRLFAVYAAVSLVPVVVLGLVLAGSYRSEATRRGLAEGRSEAAIVASTAIEPLLNGDLRRGLPRQQQADLRKVTDAAIAAGSVVRLRLRDLDGKVVYSNDGSGLGGAPRARSWPPRPARSSRA